MQSACRRPSVNNTPKARVNLQAPKVDFRNLLASLRPETLRNPLLAPPKSAGLVAKRPSCLRLKVSRPNTSQGQRGWFRGLTARVKSYTLLTATYTPRGETGRFQGEDTPPSQEHYKEVPALPSENSSVMIDKQHLTAALSPSTFPSTSQHVQVDLYDSEPLPTHTLHLPLPYNPPKKPPIPRSRTIKSALPSKRLVRTYSHTEFTPITAGIPPSSIADSLQQRVQTAKNRVERLKSVKSMSTMATQTLDSAAKKGKIDVYFPEDLRLSEW